MTTDQDPTKPLTERSRRKREAVLEAAKQEFLTKGFESTSMDRVAAAANVSKPTIYSHFATKEILYEAIVAQLVSRIEAMPQHQYEAADDLQPQLVQIGNDFADTITSPSFFELSRIVISRFMLSPELAQATAKEQMKLRKGCVAWLEAATANGRLEVSDPERAVGQFYGLIKELVFWPQLINGAAEVSAEERRRVVADAARMFLRSYQTQPPRGEQR